MRWCELFEDNAIVPNDKPDVTASEERARLLHLVKARGLDLSPPQITPAEISAFIRGKQHGS